MPAACERVMHVFTTDSFVSHHNGGEEADCGRSGLEGGLEGDQEGGFGRGWTGPHKRSGVEKVNQE